MINIIKRYDDFRKLEDLTENLRYHRERNIPIMESVFRIGSKSWIDLVNEARKSYISGDISIQEDDLFIITETLAGEIGIYESQEVFLDIPFVEEEINEAEYRGKKVKLNKPFRTPSGPKKFSVYTKNKSGNIVKVSFGQPGMRVNNADPKKARSFRKRMQCDNPGPKWKPRWWSCNIARYSKLLGLSSSRTW
jgi:hypothetical protein